MDKEKRWSFPWNGGVVWSVLGGLYHFQHYSRNGTNTKFGHALRRLDNPNICGNYNRCDFDGVNINRPKFDGR